MPSSASSFIGDSVLACFEAGAGDSAIRCALACLERFRAEREAAPTGDAAARVPECGPLRSLGTHSLKGKSQPVELLTPEAAIAADFPPTRAT